MSKVIIHGADDSAATWEALRLTYGKFLNGGLGGSCGFTWGVTSGRTISVLAEKGKNSITLRVLTLRKEHGSCPK